MRQAIQKTILKDIQDDRERIVLHDRVLAILTRFEGKQVTKRLATAVEKELGEGWNVHYDTSLNFAQLTIWQKDFNQQKRFTLCYDSDPTFRCADFRKHNAAYGSAAEERIRKNLKYLEEPELSKLAGAAEALIKAQEAFEQYDSYDFPALYDIERLIKEKR